MYSQNSAFWAYNIIMWNSEALTIRQKKKSVEKENINFLMNIEYRRNL